MKIGIVNDSPIAIEAIRRAIATSPKHQVAWVAYNGIEGVRESARLRPDLILMDIFMPEMDGVEATRRIMSETPCPILVVTASVESSSPKVFAALTAGAIDAVATPVLSASAIFDGTALLAKMDMIQTLGTNFPAAQKPATTIVKRKSNWLLAIGASAGGPAALVELLSRLPRNFPAAVVIIQHIDQEFARPLADWLNTQSTLPVRIAEAGDRPQFGQILLASTNDHLVFTGPEFLGYTPNPIHHSYRPSVDVFFQSAAHFWKGEAVGVLLTGMGRDGAVGLKTFRDKGWHTIAQDRETSTVYGMPKAAVELNAVVEVVALDKIAAAVTNFLSKRD